MTFSEYRLTVGLVILESKLAPKTQDTMVQNQTWRQEKFIFFDESFFIVSFGCSCKRKTRSQAPWSSGEVTFSEYRLTAGLVILESKLAPKTQDFDANA